MTARLVTVLVVGVVAVAAGLGIGAAVWAGGDHGNGAGMSSSDTGAHDAGSSMMGIAAMGERPFLQQMVPHHRSAVEMAELALEKTSRPEIRRLAQQIVSAQESEIADMGRWHRDWFGEDLVASTSGLHANVDMTELEQATGDDFDRAFLRLMIAHHASAIMMAESVMIGSPREELGSLTDEITAAQAKEIGQMQQWREQWFPPLG
jgi:uncharacterized protein (DUF305 family)